MKIANGNSFIEFVFTESHNADLACSVEVFSEGFAGKVESVWFSVEKIDDFLRQLDIFHKNRKGSVELLNESSSSDYNPLQFTIFSTDSTGHLAVKATLKKISYLTSPIDVLTTTVLFEIDSGSLISIIDDFRKLLLDQRQ